MAIPDRKNSAVQVLLVLPGDSVLIQTSDGAIHEFTATRTEVLRLGTSYPCRLEEEEEEEQREESV